MRTINVKMCGMQHILLPLHTPLPHPIISIKSALPSGIPICTCSWSALEYMSSRCTCTSVCYPSLLPPLSGAVYRGNWKTGVKEGQGTFTFKNGETFSGLFHGGHPSQQQESGEEVQLRPRTPLSSLIGEFIITYTLYMCCGLSTTYMYMYM